MKNGRFSDAQIMAVFSAGSRHSLLARSGPPRASSRRTPCPPEARRTERPGSMAQRRSCRAPVRAAAGTARGCRAHRPAPRSWSSARHANARWPELESPLCADRLLVNRNDGPVDERAFEVGVVAHRIEKTLEYPCLDPPPETPELGVPVPEGSGKSRRGEPVRTRQKTASRNRRLSFAVAPASLAFPGKCGSSRCQTRSVTTKRCSFIQTSILEV